MADFSKYTDEELTQFQKVKVTGRKVPGVFGDIPTEAFQAGERNILGDIFERPGAATRGLIRGLAPGGETPIEAYKRAAIKPQTEPRFQETQIEDFYRTTGKEFGKRGEKPRPLEILRDIKLLTTGMGVSATGLAADIATNPADLLLLLAGKTPTGGGITLGGRIGATKGGQAIGRFATRERRLPGTVRAWRKFKVHPVSDVERVRRAGVKATELSKGLVKEADDVVKANVETLKQNLQRASEKGSLEFQRRLPEFFKENSNAYGSILDDITAKLAKDPGRGITRLEMTEMLRTTLEEALEAGIVTGRPTLVIQQMIPKYAFKAGTAGGKVPFNEAVKDMRLIRGAISKSIKTKGYAPEDVVAEIFSHKFGNFIAKEIPEFSKLQKSYAPVIQAMKKSHKIFKPYAGELETKAGTQFLKRAGEEGAVLEAGERKFLEALEKGGKFAPGVGRISRQAKIVGGKIAKVKETGEATKEAIISALEQRLGKLSGIERTALLAQWKQRAAMFAGGGTLFFLIKRKIINPMLDALGGSGGGGTPTQSSSSG